MRIKNMFKTNRFTPISGLILFIFFISTISPTYSQEKDIQKSNQQWLQFAHRSKLKNNWIWNFDTGYRWKNGFDESTQFYFRSSAGYEFKSNISIAAGFNFVGYKVNEKTVRVEYRPYQDLYIRNRYPKFHINHRIRFEERWFRTTKNDENNLNEYFSFRFRYRILFGFPLHEPKPDGRLFSIIVGNEIFLNAGKDIVNNIFDQNRILVSPTYSFNKTLALTFTWSNQFAGTPISGTYLRRNLYWVRLSHYFDSRK